MQVVVGIFATGPYFAQKFRHPKPMKIFNGWIQPCLTSFWLNSGRGSHSDRELARRLRKSVPGVK
jgi:hypothetical protein